MNPVCSIDNHQDGLTQAMKSTQMEDQREKRKYKNYMALQDPEENKWSMLPRNKSTVLESGEEGIWDVDLE